MKIITEEMIQDAIRCGWDRERAEKGYVIASSSYGGGCLHIERIDCMGAFDDDHEASLQAEEDGIRIIRDMQFPPEEDADYIDTPENRKLLEKYAIGKETPMSNNKIIENLPEPVKQLINKHPEQEDMITHWYGKNMEIEFAGKGILDFNPDTYRDVVCAGKLTYADYIDIQLNSLGKQRRWFETCFYNIPTKFTGRIGAVKDDTVCFEAIRVEGMFRDGTCFTGRETHVWMQKSGFEKYTAGDSLSFTAEVYKYIKTGNGERLLDYGLRNPREIRKVESYDVPNDSDLASQAINAAICETCPMNEQCSGIICLRDEREIENLREILLSAMRKISEKE